jgi:hypothetical protein
VRIEHKRPSWDSENFRTLGSLELYSTSGEFTTGVFHSLFRDHRNEIHQFVSMTARYCDLRDVHSISPRTWVNTFNGPREWIEFDFLDRLMSVSSYRLQRLRGAALRWWSLLGSNDRTFELDEWTLIDTRRESREGEFGMLHTFDCFGGPFRYYRLDNEGPRWDEHSWYPNALVLGH